MLPFLKIDILNSLKAEKNVSERMILEDTVCLYPRRIQGDEVAP